MFDHNYLSEQDILNLKNIQFCKRIFSLSYPLLINKNESRYDRNGHSRYYKDIYGGKYFVCSQWYKDQYESFNNWYNNIINQSNIWF